MGTIAQRELDPRFKYEVAQEPGGEYLKRCYSCGTCSGGCLIAETVGEFDPRKTIRMVLLGMREAVLSSPSLWQCLMCHNCSFHCPQDVRFADVISALRHLAVKKGYVHPPVLQNLIFHTLLPSQARLEFFSRPLAVYQGAGLQALVRKSRVLDHLPEKLASLEYLPPRMAFRPARGRIKTMTPAKGRTRGKVGFFLGCAHNLVFGQVAQATVSVLSQNSFDVMTPKSVECCGMPFLGYGELEQATRLARHNIEVFEAAGVEAIITDCGTCGSTLKGYGDLLKHDAKYAPRAAAFSQKVRDVSEFLAEAIDPNMTLREVKETVTYHDSCHLLWGQEVSAQPRHLLSLIPGLDFVEMKEAGTCCGGAGSYNITHYETSMTILSRKMGNVAATGATLIAAGCPGCRMQLRLGAKRQGLNARVVHPIELLNRAYQGT